ncbi:MAG: hypothetical protein K6D94_02480 [Clostridiales bacterium]|nr:hypothetical protein [Clostridiales bacterium]
MTDSIETAAGYRENLSEREKLWLKYLDSERRSKDRIEEDSTQLLKFGGVSMKYGMQIIGTPDENGLYPLYIALHGGGSDETGEINEDQWRQMSRYYLGEVKNGVYVNPRAVRNTWDCHSNPESFPLYDRLIENMIIFRCVDPNRVYLLGFSAGGDGVYQISPRMADRFAAVNMSAGHPNGIKLDNLYNTPIQLQVGINDVSYNRNTETARYGIKLDDLNEKYGGGYEHRVNIHLDRAHNFADYDSEEHLIVEDPAEYYRTGEFKGVKSKTGAVSFLDAHVRDPLPETVVWNLAVRADQRDVESFYWLSAPKTTTKGVVKAVFSRETNSVTIDTDGRLNGDLSILLSTEMFDFDSKITVIKDGISYEITPQIRKEVMEETLVERGDPSYIFEDRISLSQLTDG